MSEQSAVSVRNLKIHYGDRLAVRVEQLDVPARGVLALIGPSGCGKSSLLKVLAGLPDKGSHCAGEIFDVGVLRQPGRRPPYSLVYQTPVVFPVSIEENLAVVLKKRGVPRGHWLELIAEALRVVGLLGELGQNWSSENADAMSGGQKQRLCIARGLLADAKVLLLDEPCSALDPHSTDLVEAVIADIARVLPVVLVTHNLGQARRLATSAAVMCVGAQGGYLCETGSAQRCLVAPETHEAKIFLAKEIGVG